MTRGVNGALAADLPAAMPELLRLLDIRAAAETDVARLLEAFPDLVQAYRYGDVRGTDTGRLGDVVAALLGRACAGFPVALGGLAPEAADRYRRLIDKANAAVGLLGEQAQQLWRNTLLAAGFASISNATFGVVATSTDLLGLRAYRTRQTVADGRRLCRFHQEKRIFHHKAFDTV